MELPNDQCDDAKLALGRGGAGRGRVGPGRAAETVAGAQSSWARYAA